MTNNNINNDNTNIEQGISPDLLSTDIANANVARVTNSRIDNPRIANHSSENKLPAPDSLSNNSSAATAVNKTGHGGHLELLEERPVINKERLDVGKVTVTKHARTKTINVPIELIEEYITVRTEYYDDESQYLLVGNYDEKDILRHVEPSLDSNAVVTINGKQVEIGDEPIEIIISRQVATITKDTYAIQEVAVNKTTHIHTDSIQVELKHEELNVQEEGFLEHEGTRHHKK
ncbi:YsnF/AvaK domain-containing protein [Psychrobacter urativorans]|uniref:DUF2382 domain-containing protein n=1 Tax=Psychrobacter urativorans TaxID=45610 RepID=A0A0M4U777_9GAMM|nr:DUF2382 domain-containing protein [Psychrobacter urativorans]ALF59964.1 hypothetical protein AOC03_07850 [Psychrobacter urativorans]